jgi:glycosyltransferase involved in cell wall biosynthesis
MHNSPLRIVFFGADMPWNRLAAYGFRRRNTCLLREFANHPDVERLVDVTGTTRMHLLRTNARGAIRELLGFYAPEKVRDVYSLAWIPGQRWIPAIARINRAITRRAILRALGDGKPEEIIQWCYWPGGYSQARALRLPGKLIFDADNDILSCPNLAERREAYAELMEDCLKHADAIVGGSRRFLRGCTERGFKKTLLLRNGVDPARFGGEENMVVPEDLLAIPRPRIGYIGTLSRWMDFPLLEQLAMSNPRWSFVLIGNPYRTEIPEMLRSLGNVHFLGERTAADIPCHLAGLDVGLVLYQARAGANSDGDSMKVYEYLAAGLPVVSTPYHPYMAEDFEGLIHVENDAAGFSRSIASCLKRSETEKADWDRKRVAFVENNSWRQRGCDAVTLMRELLP